MVINGVAELKGTTAAKLIGAKAGPESFSAMLGTILGSGGLEIAAEVYEGKETEVVLGG